MKIIKSTLVAITLIGSANATTIANGGGTSTAIFVTSTGVTLTATNSNFAIGTWNGSLFTQFALPAVDATPMAIGTGVFAGKLTGNFSDNTAAANAFNGLPIWYRVNVLDGSNIIGTAYFSGTNPGATVPATGTLFPTNGSGVGDSLSADTRNLTVLGAGSSEGSIAYQSVGNVITIGVIPEPSAALLGALGVLGLLRRRRI